MWNLPRAITAARTFIKGKNRKLRTKVSDQNKRLLTWSFAVIVIIVIAIVVTIVVVIIIVIIVIITIIVIVMMLTGEVGKSKGSTNGRDRGKGDCQGAGEDPHLVIVMVIHCIDNIHRD